MAAGNNAALQVEVVSKGIAETTKKLDMLGNAAERNEKKVTKLTDSLKTLMTAQESAVSKAAQHSNLMFAIGDAMSQVSAHATATAKAVQALNASLTQMTTISQQAGNALQEKGKKAGVVNTTLRAMTTAALAYMGVNFVAGIIKSADAWAMMTARLSVATGSMHNAAVAQEQIFEMAQNMRVPLEETGRLYTRLAPAMRELGKSSKEAKEMVEGVALALQLSGATGAETASVMLQFSQSIQAGRLNGAEFNAVAEGAPKILEALSAATGKSRGELKKMGSDGKLSVELLQSAMDKALPKWREDFAKLPVTVDGAMTRIKNAWMKAMGEMSQESGLNAGLVDTLRIFENMIPKIRDELVGALVAVGKWIKANKDELGIMWDQAKGLVKDVWNLGAAFGHVAGVITGLGNDFSLFGFALFSARLALAGIQDGFVMIGALILKLSYPLMKGLIEPLTFVATSLLKLIVDGLSVVMDSLGAGAKLVGLKAIGDGLQAGAMYMDKFGNLLEEAKGGIFKMGDAMNKAGDDALAYLASNDTAVQKLLQGEEAVTAAVKERQKYQENANPNPKKPVDEAAEKAHKKAMEEANAEVDKSIKLYRELAFAKEDLEKYGLDGDKRTAAQKAEAELRLQLVYVTDAQAKKALEFALATAIAAQELERQNKSMTEFLEAAEKSRKAREEDITSAEKEVKVLQDKINGFNLAKGAVDALALSEAQRRLNALQEGGEGTEAEVAQQQRLVNALQAVQDKKAELGAMEDNKKALHDLDHLLNPKKALDFGNTMKEAFGSMGEGIDRAAKALDDFQHKQDEIAKERAAIDKMTDKSQRDTATAKLQQKSQKADLQFYGDIAHAAKGFFKEHSKGYKAMHAVEQTFRAFELASTLENNAAKLQGVWDFVTAKGAEIYAMIMGTTVDTAATGKQLVNSAAKTTANTTEGVSKAFAQMGVWGFVGAAAIIAFMASMGAGSGGGVSAPNLSEERQKTQGTGTVFGDESAKSESLSKAFDLLREDTNIGLEYSSKMLGELRSINDGITGMATYATQTSGLRGTRADQYAAGTGSTKSFLGFSSSSKEMRDAGLTFDAGQTVANMRHGNVGVHGYQDFHEESSSWWGLDSDSSDYRVLKEVNEQLKRQIGITVGNIADGAKYAADALGVGTTQLKNELDNFAVNLGDISLKDLSGEDLEKEFAAAFSKLGDEMAAKVLPAFADFQKVGEGGFETLVRVAHGTELAKAALDNLGVSMIGLNDLVDKHGDVGTELVRQSLEVKESGSVVADFMHEIDGSVQDLIDTYKMLIDVRSTLRATGMRSDISREMIRGAGGLEELQSSLESFTDGFYSETEKAAIAQYKLRTQFAAIGLAAPQTKESFRGLVETLMRGGAASQELAGRVLALSDAFSDASQAAEDAVSSARDDLSAAYDKEADALKNVQEKMKGFSESLLKFHDSLIMNNLSPLSDMEKYQTSLAKYNDISAKAQAGDADAIGKFEAAATELLGFSRTINASGDAYTADFMRVLAETEAVRAQAGAQADNATLQLEALNKQVEGLMTINESVLTVAEAIDRLYEAMAAAGVADDSYSNVLTVPTKVGASPTTDGSVAYQLQSSTAVNEALYDEIKALREEVAQLRKEQEAQTNALIVSNFDANDANAATVVAGMLQAAVDQAYIKRTTTGLN